MRPFFFHCISPWIDCQMYCRARSKIIQALQYIIVILYIYTTRSQDDERAKLRL